MTHPPFPHLARQRTIELAPGTEMEFVLVLPGSFIMGDRDGFEFTGETDEHLVHLTQPYYLGRFPVTQAQWSQVMEENPADFVGDPQRPVESVSWEAIVTGTAEAPSFLDRLAQRTQHQCRLPTEAEWEYAAKGGHLVAGVAQSSPAIDWYPSYAGGDDPDANAWQDQNNNYSTLRGGYRQPNVLGFYDMSGNVWEWCQDSWKQETYRQRAESQAPITDPLVTEAKPEDDYRVLRGGSWFSTPVDCRSAPRLYDGPTYRRRFAGFRLVLSPSSGS